MTAPTHNSTKTHILVRGVRNHMKIFGFLKTESNQTDLKIQNPKTQFCTSVVRFSKTVVVWGQFFTFVSFMIHLATWQDQQSKYCSSYYMSYNSSSESLWLIITWTNSSSSSSWRRRKRALRGLCIREIDVESQTLVTEYYSKLRFTMPWRPALKFSMEVCHL